MSSRMVLNSCLASAVLSSYLSYLLTYLSPLSNSSTSTKQHRPSANAVMGTCSSINFPWQWWKCVAHSKACKVLSDYKAEHPCKAVVPI